MERRYAESLEEVYHHIYEIDKKIKETEDSGRSIFWFRGHAVASYNLDPNIFRGADYQYNENLTYSNNHLREEYRFQSFMARNFDNVDYKMPQYVGKDDQLVGLQVSCQFTGNGVFLDDG